MDDIFKTIGDAVKYVVNSKRTQERLDEVILAEHKSTVRMMAEIDKLQKQLERLKNTRTPELPSPCTVEQYEEITGEKFPDDGWIMTPTAMHYTGYKVIPYSEALDDGLTEIYIVQTAQGITGEGV